jgi:hypothetical protein
LQFFANQPILNSGQSHRILRREVAKCLVRPRRQGDGGRIRDCDGAGQERLFSTPNRERAIQAFADVALGVTPLKLAIAAYDAVSELVESSKRARIQELILNLTTAKVIGIDVSAGFLAIADEVIE